MKRLLYLLAAGLIVLLPQTSSAQTNAATANITAGRNQLKLQTSAGLAQADSFFAKAITNNSSNLEANLLKAATSLLLEQSSAQFQAQLTGVGVTINDNDIYNFLYTPPVDADGFLNPTPGVTTNSTLTYIKSKIPLIDAALANLGKFGNATTSSFAISLSESETATADVRIDYGDVLMLRALLKGAKAFIALMSSYNTTAEYAKIAYLEKKFGQYGKVTPQLILETFPDLMKFSAPDQRAAAKALIIAANADFQIAHEFIMNRPFEAPHMTPHLFEYGDSEQAGEQAEQFNAVVQYLNAGADLPIPDSGITINPAKLFSSTTAPRSFITSNSSAFEYGYPIRSSWPDPTFGGVVKTGAASLLDSLEDGFKDSRVEQRLLSMAERPTRKGTIKAWGSNASAQTAVPAGLTNVVQVAAGGNHTIALKADGSVAVWGSNQYGQATLPNGSLTGINQISAGENHSLALKSDGTVFGWGSDDNGQMDASVWLEDVAQVSAGGTHSLALHRAGWVEPWGDNSYGQTWSSQINDLHRVVQVAAGGTHSLALTSYGSVVAWGNNANGQTNVPTGYTQASFGQDPRGVAVDSADNVYLADTSNNKIRKMTANGTVTTLAGTGDFGHADGPGATATFAEPMGIAVDSSGNVYVADSGNGNIRKITSSGTVSTLASSVGNVEVLAVSGTTIYASDTYGHRIRKITSGGVVSTLAGSGSQGSNNGKGTSASFYEPRGLAIDSSGNVYVADLNYKIRKISANGTVTNFVGSGAYGSTDGAATVASFGNIRGLAFDTAGNLYAADTSNYKIRKITTAGVVSTIAGTGFYGSTDGTGAGATFKEPFSIAFHSSGLYVAENYKVRKVTTAGVVTTFAGAETYGSQDGVASMAAGNKITQIAAGGSHSLALTANRTVIAWGDNSSGQCAVPTGLTGVVQIAAGKAHSMAIKSDGSVVAWGNNTAGQRTIPTTGMTSYPIQAAAGGAHSLALMASGPVGAPEITVHPVSQLVHANSTVTFSVTATGANLTYQWLRNGATVAGATSSLYNFTATFANAGNYTVRVSNSLGNATSEPAVLSFHPQIWTSVPSIGNFTTAAGTPSAAKSFTVNGTGAIGAVNIIAPLGFEVSTDNSTFSSSLTLGKQGGMIQSVYRGDFNKATGTIWESGSGREFPNQNAFAAITSNGSVVTWGSDYIGGNSTRVASALSSNVTAIYSNYNAFAALKKDGSVVTLGSDNSGGNSTSVASALSSNVTAVYSSRTAFAALKRDGSVVTWGDDHSGGNSTSVASNLSSNVAAVFSAEDAFAALKKDGSVVTWGSDYSGGNSTSVASSLTSNVTAVFSTGGAFAALKKDGSVVTWGRHNSGGNSTSVASSLSSNVTIIFSNYNAFAALKKDGSVVTWGDNPTYYPGTIWGADSSDVVDKLSSGVKEIFANGDHGYGAAFAALKEDGSVVTWGQEGLGGNSTLVAESLRSNVSAVYSSRTAFAALKRDGSVVTWGRDNVGGNSTSVASSLSSNVTAIYSNGYAFAALKKDGSVVTWGSDNVGGNSTSVASALSSNVTAIYSNPGAFAALKKDGTVVTWGEPASGGANGPANIGAGEAPSLPRTIFVRLISTTQSGPVSGNVSVSSNGLTTQTVAVSGMVNPSSVPVITSNATASGTLNVPFSYQIAATNPPILSYSATLPLNSGLSLNSTTGLISGTPTLGGNFTVNLVARNLVGNSTVKQLALNIVIPPRIWTSVPSIGNFTAGTGSPSGARSFTINGTSLTGPVTLLAPPGFEVSTDNSTFSTTATLGTPGGRIQSVYRGSFNTATGKIWETGSGQEFPNGRAFAAITANGSVVTWGEDMHGGGGNSTSVSSLLSSNVTAVYSTTNAFAALKKDGSVVAWGSNWEGGVLISQLEAGGSTNVSGLLSSNVTAVYSTGGAFAALKKNGSVVTWGYFGAGGDSSLVASSLSSNVSSIYSNSSAFAALKKNGSVVTWGGATSGNSSSVSGALSSNVTAIFSNRDAFAALKKDGSVVTWGMDSLGGNSSSAAGSLSSNVTAIYSTQDAFAALKKDGSVIAWGRSESGGSLSIATPWDHHGDIIYNYSYVDQSLSSNVTAIYSNNKSFAALKKDGSVVTWGEAYLGGDSSDLASALSSNVTHIYSNAYAYAALKKDGSVVTWGFIESGGNSSEVAQRLSSNVTSIHSTKNAFAALKKDGSVVTWGNGFNGGNSSAVSGQLSSNVTAIYSTETSFAAVKKDGSVVTWGEPNAGGSGGPTNIGVGGPPTLPQTVFVRLAATNQTGVVSGTISISTDGAVTQNVFVSGIVNPSSVPVITSNATASGTLNVPFSYQITATNPPILSYSANLPTNSGLSLNSTTGLISGTPILGGNFIVNLVARNLVGNSTIKQLTLNLVVPPRIWTSVPSIGNFTAGTGSPSGARSFTINGTSLTGPVKLLAPPGFEVSTDNSTFSSTATLGTPGGRIQSVYRGDFTTATGKIWEIGSGQEFPNQDAFAAITANGSVVTWGSDYSGGNSTSVASALSSNVTAIYSNGYAFAALKKDGSLVTWGEEYSGGNSTSVASALSSNVTEVYSAGSAFAALKADGSVVTWGDVESGGSSTSVAIALSSNVTEVYSNTYAFAALKKDGSVVTWGSDYGGGKLSVSTYIGGGYSFRSIEGSVSSNVTAIYSNRNAFAALKRDGSVVTWGSDYGGGNSTSVASALSSNVTEVYSAGIAFAALKKDGSVVTWGSDYSGGNSTSVASALSSNVTAIYSNGYAFAALKKDGSLVTWGEEYSGGNSTSVASALSSNVKAVYSTSSAFAALKADGSVVTWGDVESGGSSTSVAIALSSNVTEVYSNTYAFAALKKDGSVVTWGHYENSPSIASNVKAVYSTSSAFAAVKKDGSVVTWGEPASGGTNGPANIGAGGPPSLPATAYVRLSATNQTGPVSGNISISTDGAVSQNVFVSGMVSTSSVPVITSNATADGTLGAPFSYQISATNPPILGYSNSGKPPIGITVNKTTGIISGTPAEAGNFTMNLFARNSAGNSSARRLDIAIAPAPSPQITYFGTQGAVPFEAYNTFVAPVLQVLIFNPSGSAMKYQWYFNGAPIAGATQSTYNMGTASDAKVGFYSVLVTNATNQSVASPNLAFSLKPSAVFSISGPVNQRFSPGANATFTVTDLSLPPGNATVTYQWLKNGVAIPGATGVTYTIPSGVTSTSLGAYSVQITTKIGNAIIGTVVSKSWSVALQDSGILIYNLAGNATRTSGAKEAAGTISGYFLIDRANDNAAIIQTYGSGFAKRNSLEMRPDIAAASTGPVVGSRTVFAGSLNSGEDPVDHDMSWITGRDEEITVAIATTTPSALPALKVFAPSAMSGTLGTLVRGLSSVEIDSFNVILTINKPLTTTAIRNGHTLEQAILATRAAANAAGYIDDASTPTPSTNMVLVQGGTLPQGSELAGQPVATFRIGKYEVTWDEWQEVRTWAIANGYSDLAGVGHGAGGNHPVQNVSWYDVLKWCNAKSQKEGLMPVYHTSGAIYKTGQATPTINPVSNGYKLPSEAEWEWAARGGVSSQGYTYSGSNEIGDVGWSDLDYPAQTHEVGLKANNELGLFDMSGNVAEWCFDESGNTRAVRGGGWEGHYFIFCAVGYRDFRGNPSTQNGYFGFRVARYTGE